MRMIEPKFLCRKIIPLVELDEIYRHFERIKNSNYKITFAEFVDKWKNKGYKIQ